MAAAAPRVSTSDAVKNSFSITSADGTPLAIPPGEYYINTKARPQWLMQNTLSNRARRVHACLDIMTVNWQQERAIVMVNGRKVAASREDISDRTRMPVQDVSKALLELKAAGLGDCKEDPSDKRKLEIYSWAVPRPVEKPQNPNRAHFVSPPWLPENEKFLTSFIKRRRIKTYDNLDHLDETARTSYLNELMQIAREAEELELRIARMLEPECAQGCINKEAIPVIPKDNTSSSSEQYPEEPTTTTNPNAPEEDVSPVREAAKETHDLEITRMEAEAIVQECRLSHDDPSITPKETAYFVTQVPKIRPGGSIRNPIGFLRKATANKIERDKLAALRAIQDTVRRHAQEILSDLNEVADDPVVKQRKCPQCKGLIEEYQSGFISWCRCGPPGAGA